MGVIENTREKPALQLAPNYLRFVLAAELNISHIPLYISLY